MEKVLYIIAGCNGAGKTTAATTILPEILKCREFVNADEIARGLSPFNPESVAFEAGRYMLLRIKSLLESGQSFSIETTLSTRAYRQLVIDAHNRGYRVELLFFWLRTPELAIRRVAQRVREGGHHVPDDVVRRRYSRGIANLFNLFMGIVDFWALYDNSETPRRRIAYGGCGSTTVEVAPITFNQIKTYVG